MLPPVHLAGGTRQARSDAALHIDATGPASGLTHPVISIHADSTLWEAARVDDGWNAGFAR